MSYSKLAHAWDDLLDPDRVYNRSLFGPFALVCVLAAQGVVSFGVSVVIVVLPYIVALVLYARHDRARTRTLDEPTRRTLSVLLGVQALHSAEELVFQMYTAMPALFADLLHGEPSRGHAWPVDATITGSFTMIAFWSIAMALHHRRTAITSFAIYMFVVSMCANSVFHPIYELYLLCSPSLASHLRANGLSGVYFPGIGTSTVLGIIAFPILRRLRT